MKKIFLILIVSLFFVFVATSCDKDQSNDVVAPTLTEALEANTIDKLFEKYENIHISTTHSLKSSPTTHDQYLYKLDSSIVMDSIYISDDSKLLLSERGQVSYIVNNDKLEVNIFEERKSSFGFFESIVDPTLVGSIYLEDDSWIANFWCKGNEQHLESHMISYTVWFDISNLHAKKISAVIYDKDLVTISSFISTVSYNEENFGLEDSAFSKHTSNDNPIKIEFVINPNLENEVKIPVNTCKSSSISIYTEDLELYPIYPSIDDIHNITSLEDVEGSEVTLYAILGKEVISFERRFSNDDVVAFTNLIDEFKKAGLEGNKGDYVILEDEVFDWIDFLRSQYYIYLIAYYSQPNEENASQYRFVTEKCNDLFALYNETLKEFAISSPIKDYIFEGYTEEELEELQVDNLVLSELQSQVSNLEMEYQMLEKSSTWEDDVDNIYLQIIKLNNQIANLKGYDNYYDYASDYVYRRYFTEEDRSNLRQLVQEKIIPLFSKVNIYKQYYKDLLTSDETNDYTLYLYGSYTSDQEVKDIIHGYISTFEGYNLKDIMSSAFDDGAAIFADDRNSLGTAFVSWDPLYQHSVAYFSYYYQEPLTIVHELGHYGANYHYDFFNLSYDVAETHSQANEWLFLDYLKESINENAWNAIYMYEVSSSLEDVIISTMIDDFEESIYKEASINPDMTIDDLRETMVEISNKYVDEDQMITKEINQEYIRSVVVDNPVYYLSYATSQLASQSYAYLIESVGYEQAQKEYVKLMEEVDPTLRFKEIINELDLLNPFEEESYDIIEDLFTRKDVEYVIANKDVIITETNEIRPLFNISEDNPLVNFNDDGKTLMIFVTNSALELKGVEYLGSSWMPLRVVSADEMIKWYDENSESVSNWDQRLTELLSFQSEGCDLGFFGMWVDPEDLNRLGYQSDITKQLDPSNLIADNNGNYQGINDEIEDVILDFRYDNLSFSKGVLYSMLGYTYDLGGDDVYGLSEFVLDRYAPVEKAFSFATAEELVEWLESQ